MIENPVHFTSHLYITVAYLTMLCARSSSSVSRTTTHQRPNINSSYLARRNAASAASEAKNQEAIAQKLEVLKNRLAAEEKIMQTKTIPQQVVFEVNNRYFSSLPQDWSTSHQQSYKTALSALESSLKGKFAEAIKKARDPQNGLLIAHLLIAAVNQSNPTGEVKDRLTAFQKAVDTWESGPQDLREVKNQEIEKLLKQKKDRLAKNLLSVYTDHPIVGAAFTPDELKYLGGVVDRYAQGYVDVWAAEAKATLQGLDATEIRRIVEEKKRATLEADAQELSGIVSHEPAFEAQVKHSFAPSLVSPIINALKSLKA